MNTDFNLKLILLFNGTRSVIELVEKAGLVCRLCNVKQLKHLIPLRLVVGTFAIYQQLRDERTDADKIKTALYTAFAMDEFAAYEKFTACRMQPDESVRATEAHSILWSSERPHTQLHICSWTTSPGQTIPLCIVKNGQASH